MASIVPTVGRVVLYVVTAQEAREINQRRHHAKEHYHLHQHERRGVQLHLGNEVTEGDIFPADIVRVWGATPDACVNLNVKLDGNDHLWATSRQVSDEPKAGFYHWMDYQKGQAAKTEVLEAKLAEKAG